MLIIDYIFTVMFVILSTRIFIMLSCLFLYIVCHLSVASYMCLFLINWLLTSCCMPNMDGFHVFHHYLPWFLLCFFYLSLCIFMYNFIIGCLHFGIDFCAFVYVVFLFCSVTNYIQCCAIGPIKFDGKNTIYSNISCSQGQH